MYTSKDMKDNELCPCGSKKEFGSCCGPIIAGTKKAETAETTEPAKKRTTRKKTETVEATEETPVKKRATRKKAETAETAEEKPVKKRTTRKKTEE